MDKFDLKYSNYVYDLSLEFNRWLRSDRLVDIQDQRLALYNTEQTQSLDKIAIAQAGISGRELMQLAGERAYYWIKRRYPGCENTIVLCGKGNNGGDGYVVAALLQQAGAAVSVLGTGKPNTGDARSARQSYLDAGGLIEQYSSKLIANADLIIDGLLGAGLSRAPENQLADIINEVNKSAAPCVALDLPTGLSGDTGQAYSPAIRADLTITFIGRKLGCYTADGLDYCGDKKLETLGLSKSVYSQVTPAAYLVTRPKLLTRKNNSHKGHYGNLLIAGGDSGMLGAVLLAGTAALRSGCGLVNIVSGKDHLDMPALYQAELMSHRFEQDGDSLSVFENCNAMVIGPGTTNNQWGKSLFRVAMNFTQPRVIDAGGLRILATHNSHFNNQVLTPHPGEAAALLKVDTKTIQADRIQAAKDISKLFGGVCVLKGAGTIICDQHHTLVCDKGNPGMASAGMGDVLAGIIGALLARGLDPLTAACTGVWWHAASADIQAEKIGEEALLASDVVARLAEAIPRSASD